MRSLYGDRFEVMSAGTEPSNVNPFAIAAMHECNIDISAHRSQHVDEFTHSHIDYIVTVCDHANDSCPVFHCCLQDSNQESSHRLHHSFIDPSRTNGSDTDKLQAFINTREEIRKWLNLQFATDMTISD